MANSIKLKTYVDIVKEKVAAAAFYPGSLLYLNSSGTVAKHAAAGQPAAALFALEDSLQGKKISEAYAAADQVQVLFAVPGEEVYAILNDGQNVAIGDYLESAGNGYLQKYVADTEDAESSNEVQPAFTVYSRNIVAMALEAVNLSESSGAESSGEGAIDASLGYSRRIKVCIV